MKLSKALSVSLIVFTLSCKVVFIDGYDGTLNETVTKIQKDFNLFFIKLSRTIQDNDPNNQKIENYQEYYDNMEVDLIVLKTRADYLGKKSTLVKRQILNLDSTLHAFENIHRQGMKDRVGDDRRDLRNNVNSSIGALIKLQEELKPKK